MSVAERTNWLPIACTKNEVAYPDNERFDPHLGITTDNLVTIDHLASVFESPAGYIAYQHSIQSHRLSGVLAIAGLSIVTTLDLSRCL